MRSSRWPSPRLQLTSRIAADLKRSREATLANLERLEVGNYISRSAAAGHAYSYRVFILAAELTS
jgi:hypothetical protein